MEIYNEKLTDLLDRTNTHDLKIREHPNMGTMCNIYIYIVEIYNEKLTDLLDRTNTHDLKIREHPNMGTMCNIYIYIYIYIYIVERYITRN